ncbi:solute carrier family 10 member 6-like [Chanos chanos]|uniref:Solute carrier family 10 member 6-like n=1 Tax=Chanos chanos TaxID=29144 RepID=A0A6J2UUR7_CHACN|nr:solute carrier family 10 member 6 [Chanos chanos]
MWNNSSDAEVGPSVNGTSVGVNGSAQQILNVILPFMLALVIFALGCSVEFGKVWYHLQRPWGILVGLVCQFGLMPLIAFLLGLAFRVTALQAVAILIMGCCPGGIISNILTHWVDGDISLSIAMTTCSTLLGLGMMPLCLYVYSHFGMKTGNVQIPYLNIAITVVSMVVPVACGVLVGSVVGCLVLTLAAIASVVQYRGSWNIEVSVLIIGMIFPMIGYAVGFIISIIVQQPWPRCRTIALETGAQNCPISVTVLQLSFPAEQLVQMFTFPLIYASFQLLSGLLLAIG